MKHEKITSALALGIVCVMAASSAAVAQDYLKGKTSYRPFDEKDNVKGDYPADYQYSGSANIGEDLEARQRVESRVKAAMKNTSNHVHGEATPESFAKLVQSAQAGDPYSIGHVGYAYQYGLGTEKNEQQALAWFKRAIDYGMTEYYANIGEMYRDYDTPEEDSGFFSGLRKKFGNNPNSTNLPDDNNVARQWFERGVNAGNWESYMKIGEMFRDGAGGLKKDLDKAQWYYNEGRRMHGVYQKELHQKIQQSLRAQAEKEEGLRPANAPASVAPRKMNDQGVLIGSNYCTLLTMGSPTGQYRAFYEAYCSNIEGEVVQDAPATVTVKGMECQVQPWPDNDAGKSFELRCR